LLDPTAILDHVPAWLMVLFRLTGIFLLAPVLGSKTIPALAKVFLVFGLSLCLYPLLWVTGTAQTAGLGGFVDGQALASGSASLWMLLIIVATELLIGYVIGYCASLPLIGLQIGGHVIDQQMGISAGGVFNPELDAEAGVVGQLLFMLGLAIFVMIGGLEIIFATLVGTFESIPIGGFLTHGPGIDEILGLVLGLLTMSFEIALRIAAPLLCIVFLESVAMGFIARTVPQLNILSVGFIIRILGGVVLLIVGIGTAATVFSTQLLEMLQHLTAFFTI
jgi:flagellar biosynthetic protein FliR